MPINTGSFASSIGGSSAIKQALLRRGMGAGILDQQSPASAGGGTPIPAAMPAPQGPSTMGISPQASMTPPKPPETDLRIALTALTKFVGSESNLKKSVMDMRSQGMV